MSLDKLQKDLGFLASKLADNQSIATPTLAIKIAQCTKSYPHDQTLGAMRLVIDKMVDNNKLFIHRAEFKDLYNKLYSRNTKFAQLFEEELGMTEYAPEIKTMVHDDSVEIPTYHGADPILSNALNSVFDNTIPLREYSQAVADKALKSVSKTLDSWNLKASSLNIEDGNESFLVIKADYETPKGITSFHIPVETTHNMIAQAMVFMGNSGVQALNNANIKNYVTKFAGQKLKTSGTVIVGLLSKAASETREISDTELALTRLHATRQGKAEFFDNQIIGQKVAEASVRDVETPKSDEFMSFEKNFSNPYGVAAFIFGADKIKTARDAIARDLRGFGYKSAQIAVTSSDDHTVFYGVSLDAGKVAFTVPVKIMSGKLSNPTLLLCNGSVSTFSKDSINSMYVNNQSDYKVAASASPLFNLNSNQLVDTVGKAINDGNHVAAEDALNVLANSGDEKAYAIAFNMLFNGLANKTAAVKEHNCSLIVKSASSEHPVCGHTGLPLHKVYQDKHGNCCPLYRKGMDENYEGAFFNNYKILS